MKFIAKLKSWWHNRRAIIKAARLRALEIGASVLSIAADGAALADDALEKMLAVEAVFGDTIKGNEKAQKVLAILKRADPMLDNIEAYLLRAMSLMHDELNDDDKAGWERL